MPESPAIAALVVGLRTSGAAWSADTTVELWIPGEKLTSNPVRIYVTHAMAPEMKPKLQLLPSHLVTACSTKKKQGGIERQFVARDQSWNQPGPDGNVVQRSGSVVLFDLCAFPIPWYKSMMRLTPVLQ